MSASLKKVCGVILAGGRARRLGGGDKCLRLLDARPILAHAVERFGPQCAALALNANGAPERFRAWNLPVIPDASHDHQGPLAGAIAALTYAEKSASCEYLATLPADAPFPPLDLVARLRRALQDEAADIAVARSDGRAHHLTAVWRLGVRSVVEDAFAQGARKAAALRDRLKVCEVEWPCAPIDPFFNVNTPEDLQIARAFLEKER